ncbi:transglutaminase-like domain-containing protein [Desulfosediminicola ganghwensis]|uniref:transglutaminase-like domain-containing protein n=1 Tax=Desulfosediminicola ganghwensis TaxID=2569540 RepID=UPI0010ACB888|nr:transglutaminase family protein [Desulfosediminicola ganghwensis]
MTHTAITDLQPFLAASEYIDWQHPEIKSKAARLASCYSSNRDIAHGCYLFVRDEIKHSGDWQLSPTTCKASEVLRSSHGWCYAKSHLLVALLRANSIPAGLCYQRLTIEGDVPPFCIHGLVAVYLDDFGWYRIDPRGNKEGVTADFCPPGEKLAFSIISEGEADLPGIFAEPVKSVIDCLHKYQTYKDFARNLPDSAPSEWSPQGVAERHSH